MTEEEPKDRKDEGDNGEVWVLCSFLQFPDVGSSVESLLGFFNMRSRESIGNLAWGKKFVAAESRQPSQPESQCAQQLSTLLGG